MFFSFGSQATWNLIFAAVILSVWLICFLLIYFTHLITKHFGLRRTAKVFYVLELILAAIVSGLMLWPVINFYLPV